MPRTRAVPWLVFLGGSLVWSMVALTIHARFGSGEDLTIFAQAIGNVAHGHAPLAPVKGPGANLLGDHWHPIILVLAPLFWIWDDPAVLLVAQAVLVSAAGAVLTREALARCTRLWVVGPALLVSPGVSVAMVSDFHEVAVGAPVLALACSAWLRRRWNLVLVWATVLLLVKEDAGLMDIGLAVALLWRGHRWRAALLAVASTVWMVLAVRVFIPAFNATGQWTYSSMAHGGPVARMHTMAQALVWPGLATATAVVLVGVTAGAALRSPLVLVAVLPWLARATVPDHHYWVLAYHYSLLPAVALFFAALDSGVLEQSPRLLRGLCMAAVTSTVALVPISAARMVGTPPGAARAAVSRVPAHAQVVTMSNLSSHLAARDEVTLLVDGVDPLQPGQPSASAQYALIDARVPWAEGLVTTSFTHWRLVWSNDRYVLLCR